MENWQMAEPSVPYWIIRHLESGESVPGQAFTVFISEGDSEDTGGMNWKKVGTSTPPHGRVRALEEGA
ncbi:hypothetical protein [Streptomyces badius]